MARRGGQAKVENKGEWREKRGGESRGNGKGSGRKKRGGERGGRREREDERRERERDLNFPSERGAAARQGLAKGPDWRASLAAAAAPARQAELHEAAKRRELE